MCNDRIMLNVRTWRKVSEVRVHVASYCNYCIHQVFHYCDSIYILHTHVGMTSTQRRRGWPLIFQGFTRVWNSLCWWIQHHVILCSRVWGILQNGIKTKEVRYSYIWNMSYLWCHLSSDYLTTILLILYFYFLQSCSMDLTPNFEMWHLVLMAFYL